MPSPGWVRFAAPLALASALHTALIASPWLTREAHAQPAQGKGGVSSLILKGSELFDDQQYEESIQVLSAALVRPGTSTQDKMEIYRLLAYNYITLKRTEEAEYRIQGRGGKGIITIKTTERNGKVAGACQVHEDDEVMLITNQGMLIRMAVREISVIGRNTQGVRLITLESREEKVVGVARLADVGKEAPGGDESTEGDAGVEEDEGEGEA